jgi:hypothetical protein
MEEREQMLRDAFKACFKAGENPTVKNIRGRLPKDFFLDFDSGEPLDDATVLAEIQEAQRGTTKPVGMIAVTPDGRPLAGFDAAGVVVEDELLGGDPEDDDQPLAATAAGSGSAPVDGRGDLSSTPAPPVLSPQARLAAAREREKVLIGELPILHAKVKDCRAALAEAIRAYQDGAPKQTHADLARDFIRASQAEKEARARGESWAMRPARERRGTIAPVDSQRIYSQGGNADDFARRHMKNGGNRRGAYPKNMMGAINRDPSRGPVPAPVEAPRPTVPALAK